MTCKLVELLKLYKDFQTDFYQIEIQYLWDTYYLVLESINLLELQLNLRHFFSMSALN